MIKRLILLIVIVVLPSTVDARIIESTAADRRDVSVTIYNENLGLIREVRSLGITKGIVSLRFQDVASAIDPTSVRIEVLKGLGGFELLEQNYEFDLMSPEKLMEKYVGRNVELVVKHPQTGEESSIRAELLSMKGGPVYRVGDKIHVGHPGRVVLPEIPDNLIARPTLVWLVDGKGGDGEIETSYLTSGMNWKADYVALLGDRDRTMDVTGWVTLTNRSGAGFENARLKLVAGKIHRAGKKRDELPLGDGRIRKAAEMQLREEPFFEYHLYSLPRRTTLKDNQTKQVELLRADRVGVDKEYILRFSDSYFPLLKGRIGEVVKRHPEVKLIFRNEKGNNLGVPLPAGVFRFYKKDSGGSLQLVGEDRVMHVPEGEKVSLLMGEAFDIVTERVITDFEVISKETVYEYEVKINLRNSKEEDVMVKVVELMRGDWEIIRSSHETKKESARTAIFAVPVKRKGESVLTYRVRVKEL